MADLTCYPFVCGGDPVSAHAEHEWPRLLLHRMDVVRRCESLGSEHHRMTRRVGRAIDVH